MKGSSSETNVGTSPFLNRIWVAMEIMHLNIVQTDLFLGELFSHLDDCNKQFGVHKNLSCGAR